MPDKNKLCATLRYLSYGVVCCQSVIPMVFGTPVASGVEYAGRIFTGVLSFGGVFAAGALGNAFYDVYFRSGLQIFQNQNLIDVTGEAMSRALKEIVQENNDGTNHGIEKLSGILNRTKDNWFRLAFTDLQPEIENLSAGEIKQLLEDPNISTDENLFVLISELTLAPSGESYLDDETIAFVAGELKTKLPAAFRDVLTDEQSGKPYRNTVLTLLQLIVSLITEGQPQRTLPSNLPTVRDFIGRGEDLDALRESYKSGKRVFLLHGVGGVGKTALALEFAGEIKGEYAAHILVDMQGLNRPVLAAEAAMYEIVKQFDPNIPANLSPNELQGLYTQFLSKHKTLLVLDNADDEQQIEPLNVVDDSCLLVTSRRRFDLAGGELCEVEKMSEPDAKDLLIKICPRIGEQADDLAERCGRLPLALRAAASALKKNRLIPVEKYIADLQDRKTRLQLADPTRKNLTVEAAFDLSYEMLGADLQLRWRQLAVFPADFAADGATAIWEIDDATDTLNDLDGYSLLEVNEETGRFSLHDLARDYTTEKLTEEEFATLQRLHAKYYAEVLRFVEIERKYDYQNALDLLDLEWGNITRGQKWSTKLAKTDNHVAQICSDYSCHVPDFIALRLHPRNSIEWHSAGLIAAQKLGNKPDEGVNLGNLGLAYFSLGDYRKAVEYHEKALNISREIGSKISEAKDLSNLGIAYFDLGDHTKAIEYHEQALKIFRSIGDRLNEGKNLGGLGNVYLDLGDYRKAIDFYEQSLVISRESGDRIAEGISLGNVGNIYYQLYDYRKAIEYHQESLKIKREIGDKLGEGNSLGSLGSAYYCLGEIEKACGLWRDSLAILEKIESPNSDTVRQSLERYCPSGF